MKIWLNGVLSDEGAACISPFDHGLLVGDGVFETLRCYGGTPFALREHLERLATGAGVLGISVPELNELEAGALALAATQRAGDSRLRITITSGLGPPGLIRGEGGVTALMTVSAVNFSALSSESGGASAVVSPWRHDEKSPLAGVKTTSRAASIVALADARSKGADEALFLNHAGSVCEATTANLFVVRDNRVETPPLTAGALAGITRERVLRLCLELGIEAGDADLPAGALRDADELFLTSSMLEIQPLVVLDGSQVGDGRPGRITMLLRDAYSRSVSAILGQ